VVEAILIMLGVGAVCGSVLSIASKVFYVYEDPRIARVEDSLAGANCGGCGYAGCAAAAAAVVDGKAPPTVCVISGPETSAAVAEIMGMDPGTAEPLRSLNTCDGGARATDKYLYMGVGTCSALSAMYGGKRDCTVGCLGLGDCIRSCNFDAIHMGPDAYPVVDLDKCVGCGACEKACPKSILTVRTLSRRLLHLNRTDDALAPCQQTCPAEIDIPTYIDCDLRAITKAQSIPSGNETRCCCPAAGSVPTPAKITVAEASRTSRFPSTSSSDSRPIMK
jgi:formate dehydrogenase (NADP+) beta subunit